MFLTCAQRISRGRTGGCGLLGREGPNVVGRCNSFPMYDGARIDGDLLVRRERRFRAPLQPSDAMVAAPVHIALVSWRQVGGDQAPPRLWWLVMTSDLGRDRGRPRESLYYMDGEQPAWEEVIESVSRELQNGGGAGWVLVPGKRVATAEKLYEHGLPVTRGRCGENRAIDKAIERMQYYRQQEEASPRSTRTKVCGNRVRRNASVASNLHSPQWFPSTVGARLGPTERLIVATDASIGPNGVVAVAALSDRGETVLDVSDRSGNAGEAELRAMVLAIEALAGSVWREMCILSDSADAVDIANKLIDGRVPARGARGIGELDVDRFVAAWQRSSCAISVHQLKAHVGHPLNEAADELACIGRLATLHPRMLVENELRQRIAVISASAVALTESQVRVPGRDRGPTWTPD